MKKFPKVSIILPTFNRADWLKHSIGSVIIQTFSDWELIVWDDGSIDDTEEVVKSFHDQRIHYYKSNNKGAAFARNRAIEKAKGNYIAFLDSDDQWTEIKLSMQIHILQKYPKIDLLFGDYLNENLASGVKGTGFNQNRKVMENLQCICLEQNVYLIQKGMPECLLISNFIATDTVIIRKSVLSNTGKMNESLRNSEDLEYWWRMNLQGVRFAYVDDMLLKRNKPSDSLSSSSPENYQNCIRALDSCSSITIQHKRIDLVKKLNPAYRNAWLGLVRQYNISGQRKSSMNALIRSWAYGVSWVSFFLMIELIFGFKNISKMKSYFRKSSR